MAGPVWAIAAAMAFALSNIAVAKGIRETGVALATTLMLLGGRSLGPWPPWPSTALSRSVRRRPPGSCSSPSQV